MEIINNLVINLEETNELIKILDAKSGLELHNYKNHFFQKRVTKRIKNLNLESIRQYIDYIESNPNEANLFLEKFTVNYSHFFRNYEIYDKLGEYIQTHKDCQRGFIRVWSAACASGEEPYSVAIFFEDFKKKHNYSFDYEIFASDIDQKALNVAKKGIYNDYALYNIPENYKSTFFKENTKNNNKMYILDENIKNKIEFVNEDVINGHSKNNKYDIILCRNLIIYLNKNALGQITKILESHLVDQGLLILGKTEKLSDLDSFLEIYDIKNKFYIKCESNYKKDVLDGYEREEKVIQKDDTLTPKTFENKLMYTQNNIKKQNQIPEVIESKVDFKNIEVNKIKEPLIIQTEKDINKDNKLNIQIEKISGQIPPIQENNFEIKSIDSQFIGDDLNVKQIRLQEEQISKLEKQLNDRMKKLVNLSSQISLRERDLKEKKEIIEKKEENFSLRNLCVDQKTLELEQIEKQLERKIRYLDNFEKNINKKILTLESLEQQLSQRSQQIDINKKKKTPGRKKKVNLDFIRISESNFKEESVISEGYYALINLNNKNYNVNKFTIYGLKSSIALILEDKNNKIYGFTHCSSPWIIQSVNPNNNEQINNYYDKIISKLHEDLSSMGANEKDLKSYIIGGARDLNQDDTFIKKSIALVKDKLKLIKIPVEKEDVGGLSKRSIVFDISKESLFIKKSWEPYYRKIN